MRRRLLLPALLLAAIPAFAERVTVHLQFSDSVRAAIARGDIQNIAVGIDDRTIVTKETTAVIDNVDPGMRKLHAILMTRQHGNFVADANPMLVDVKPGVEVTVPVDVLFVTGEASLHGKPFHGDINVWPSERVPHQSWGFSAPADEEGKFAFPVPRAGAYDLQMTWKNRGQSAPLPRFEFKGTEAHIAMPEGTIAGRVVDAEGKGVQGVKVIAKLNASTPQQFGALAMSDVDGNFSIEGLPAGTWTVEAGGKPVQDVVLTDGERKEGVLVRVGH
jgi:hypothetical protein